MTNKQKQYTIAFYNIENLFDTVNDPMSDDDDFLPTSRKRWTKKRYYNKLRKIGSVISKIGNDDSDEAPVIVGLAEVENKLVLSDLISSENLRDEDYNYVHYNSSDERGIDVGIVNVGKYDKEMEYVFYMTKHINKTKFNNWDILSNL